MLTVVTYTTITKPSADYYKVDSSEVNLTFFNLSSISTIIIDSILKYIIHNDVIVYGTP